MSDIRSLYAALADLEIAFTDEEGNAQTILGRDLHEVREDESIAVPIRVLAPFKERGSGASDLTLLTVGVTDVFGTMTWRIADLFLWKETGEDYGIAWILPDLVRYAGAYAEKIADAGRDLGIGTMTFQSLTLDAAVIEWPMQSGDEYFGVEAVIAYEELINP